MGALAIALVLLLPPPTPEPAEPSAFSSEGLSGAGTTLTDTGTRTPSFWARVEGRYRSGRLQLAMRVDGNSEKAGVSLEDQSTVQTLEVFALASVRVVDRIALTGVVGATRPALGVPGDVRRTWLAGPLLGNRDRYVLLGVGERDVVAPGLLGMAAWRWQMREKTAVFGDVAARQMRDCTTDGVCGPPRLGYQLRVSVAVSVWGQR